MFIDILKQRKFEKKFGELFQDCHDVMARRNGFFYANIYKASNWRLHFCSNNFKKLIFSKILKHMLG